MKKRIAFVSIVVIMTILGSCSDDSYLKKASSLTSQGNYKEALNILETKISNKKNPKYLLMHALCSEEMIPPRYRNAIEDFKNLENTKYGQDEKILFKLADWSFHVQEFEDSIVYAKRAVSGCDENARTILQLFMADSYYNLGRYDEALSVYSQMVQQKNTTPYILIDYNKLLSIKNSDDSLPNFWASFNLNEQNLEEQNFLTFYYAKALLEIGEVEESKRYFEMLDKSFLDKNLVEIYKTFCSFLLNEKSVNSNKIMYVKGIEEIYKGNLVVFFSEPDLEKLKLSVIYFYFSEDWERAKLYCTQLIKFSRDLQSFNSLSGIKEVESYLKNDRFFKIAKKYISLR